SQTGQQQESGQHITQAQPLHLLCRRSGRRNGARSAKSFSLSPRERAGVRGKGAPELRCRAALLFEIQERDRKLLSRSSSLLQIQNRWQSTPPNREPAPPCFP